MVAKTFSFPVFQGVFRKLRKQTSNPVFQFSTPFRGGKTQKTEENKARILERKLTLYKQAFALIREENEKMKRELANPEFDFRKKAPDAG
jgi:hypothetical protein